MFSKEVLMVFARLPLLFVVDSILRGSFLDFTFGSHGTSLQPFNLKMNPDSESGDTDFLYLILWNILLFWVAVISVVLVCSPVNYILDFYRWIVGAALVWVSYNCNKKCMEREADPTEDLDESNVSDPSVNATSNFVNQEGIVSFSVNFIVQLFIALAFDQISINRILLNSRGWFVHARYLSGIVLSMSFSLPIFLESSFMTAIGVSIFLPLVAVAIHLYCVVYSISQEAIVPGVLRTTIEIRDIGLDGLIMNIVEKANFSWLLRLFFFAQVVYQMAASKVIQEAFGGSWSDVNFINVLTQDVLYNMCGTLISVISLASIVTIISGWALFGVYKVIQAYEEEESLQPVVSGFLFVLLAMQTGMTAITGDLRLQLLFQNSILLVVANQHFVHNVATDLLLKASTDDTPIEKHIRPLIPFVFFFTFPFFAVVPLWSYPFRISWLLAVTVFCIELIIKSVSTIIIYTINMLHTHTDAISEDTDNLTFIVKGVCGCLEFICGIFLFLNGAYIFIFESGGFIRLFMMTIHFYCNIYQSAIKGWATYKLRLSSWEKVNRLEPAKQEQLDENSICSICYQEMQEALVLNCEHIFHKNCLQKWLSIKEICPLCHSKLNDDAEGDTAEEVVR